MSAKWITVLVVGPIAVIVVATLLILRSVYPAPPKPNIAQTQPVDEKQPKDNASPSAVDRIQAWLNTAGARHSISGDSWLNRNSGVSEIQRGLHIQLLPTTVPISAVNETLEAAASLLDQDYQQELKHIDDYKKIEEESGLKDSVSDESFRSQLDFAKSTYDEPAKKMRAAESKQPGVYKTDDAYKFIREVSSGKRVLFSRVGDAVKLKEVKTDIQGKFSMEDIPDGQYFLYACVNMPGYFAEWLVPVNVSEKDLSITLDNDNASQICDGL